MSTEGYVPAMLAATAALTAVYGPFLNYKLRSKKAEQPKVVEILLEVVEALPEDLPKRQCNRAFLATKDYSDNPKASAR